MTEERLPKASRLRRSALNTMWPANEFPSRERFHAVPLGDLSPACSLKTFHSIVIGVRGVFWPENWAVCQNKGSELLLLHALHSFTARLSCEASRCTTDRCISGQQEVCRRNGVLTTRLTFSESIFGDIIFFFYPSWCCERNPQNRNQIRS